MVRNQGTTSAKIASLVDGEKVLNMKLPLVGNLEYRMSNVQVADAEYLVKCLSEDLEMLKKDMAFR